MPVPNYPLPSSFTNDTPQEDVHPTHHNDLAIAVNDMHDRVAPLFTRPTGLVVAMTATGVAQSITQSVEPPTALTWNSEVSNTHGWWSASMPTIFTCPEGDDGLFIMRSQISWQAASTVAPTVLIRINGEVYHVNAPRTTDSDGVTNDIRGLPLVLAAGSSFDLAAYHDSASARTIRLQTSSSANQAIAPYVALYRLRSA